MYKDAFSFAKSANMILRGECGVFSPKLLECFKHVVDQYENLARAYADGLSPKAESFDTTLPPPVEQEENSLGRVRAKYFALLHYINGLLMEVDLKNDMVHLVYNPYPEMSWLQEVVTFSDLVKMLDERTLDSQSKEIVADVFQDGVNSFMEENLRRASYQLRFRSQGRPEGDCFEVTLLRINPMDVSRKSLTILCRRMSESGFRYQPEETVSILSDSTLVCRNDERFTLERLGTHIPLLAGFNREELKLEFQDSLMQMVLPEDRDALRKSYREQFQRGVVAEAEFRVRHKNGTILWILDKSKLMVGPDGKEYLNSFLTDITHTKRAYDELSRRLTQYEIILAQTENVLFEWDLQSGSIDFSDTWEKIFGFRPLDKDSHQSLMLSAYFHPDDMPILTDKISSIENGSNYETAEVRIATARGRYLWCLFRATAVRDEGGNLTKIVGIIINIDAEKQAERLLQDRAERDSLTKLLNRDAARKQTEKYLSRFQQGANCALMIIDLDNFKQVNDRHGHLFGDAVLTRTAREIEKLFRNQDIVSRIGGDEFMVVMRGVSDRVLLESRCQRLMQVLQNAFSGYKQKLPISCSMGIAVSPEHGTTYYELFNRADQALYQAKARGKNGFCFYDEVAEQFPKQAERASYISTPIDSDEEPGLTSDNIVRYAFQRLYSSRDVQKSVNDILALMGRKMNVSRVYVFENSDDNRYCSNTYEWCNVGIEPEIQNLQNISYETDLPDYEDNFDEQGIFYCPDITELPQKTYDIVAPQGIKSMLHCAIRDKGVFRGYIGFDECKEQRLWTKEQIQTLTYFSEMLAMFLLKQREHEKALSRANQAHSLLDSQNAWIYIIDPDTFQIKYLNAKSRALAPDTQAGVRCYAALAGRESCCENCPAAGIRQAQNADAVVHNSRFGLDVQAEASLVQWDGKDACMMVCRENRKKKD